MDEETKDEALETEPHGNEDDTDYKALYEQTLAASRKWESRSKSNAEKARKYDELAAGEKSVEQRIEALEAANKALENEKTRSKMVRSVAKATGVPESIVSALSANDEDSLTAQAKAIADAYKTPGGAPNAPEAGKFPKKNEDENSMRTFAHNLFSGRR